ncbi:amidohydrolase family protein [Sphingoaurantiacus capsulatus]|uniref:Amidohydrolase family protein n=1 Tax=Sphingoaurantiacus capsulatus TaxID=1771310 RepID=A0ABV7X908_9SPHN
MAALALVGGVALAAPPLVLENANLIDGVGDKPLRGVSILVRDGKIVAIGNKVAAPADARRIDLKGRWVLPGFVDAHVHPSSLGDARNMLKAGVTTGRSMLTMHFVDAGIQALHKGGATDVPEILPAGYPIVPDPGSFIPDIGGIILDTPALADLWGKPLDDEEIRRLIRANIARGATVIKVFATDRAGVLSSDPRRPMLTEAQLRVAVAEARAGGAKVAAHAHGDEGAAAAVRAGVDTIDHGALAIETADGTVVLTGCGHAGVVNIADEAQRVTKAPVYAVIGGLHLYQADDATLQWTSDQLRAAGIRHLLAAHCTGFEATYRLRTFAGMDRKTAVVAGVGSTFELGKGISTLSLAR